MPAKKIIDNKIKANIWKLYAFRLLASLGFATPVFVLFLRENGLSMTEVMITQSVYMIAMTAFMIIGGSLADRFGRKRIIVVSCILHSASWIIYSLGSSFRGFILAEAMMGISLALWESSHNAWLYDSLRQIGKQHLFKRIYGNVLAITLIMLAIGSLAGGFIAQISLRHTIIATTIMVMLAMFISFSFREPAYHMKDNTYFGHILDTIEYCYRHKRIRYLILFNAMLDSTLFAAYFLYQPYFEEMGLSLVAFGIIYFCLNLIQAAGAGLSERIERLFSEKGMLIFLMIVPAIAITLMAFTRNYIGVIMAFAVFFVTGLQHPVLNDYVHVHTHSHHRATVLSVMGTFWGLLAAALGLAVGFAADLWSTRIAMLVVAGFLLLSLLLISPIVKAGKRYRKVC